MPTGLTDVTVAIYVRGRRKSEKGVRGPEACEYVCVCVSVCHVVAGPVCAGESDGVRPSECSLTS